MFTLRIGQLIQFKYKKYNIYTFSKLHVLQLQLSPFNVMILILNLSEPTDLLDFISSDIAFQRILPLKTIEFKPFKPVVALSSSNRSFALRS